MQGQCHESCLPHCTVPKIISESPHKNRARHDCVRFSRDRLGFIAKNQIIFGTVCLFNTIRPWIHVCNSITYYEFLLKIKTALSVQDICILYSEAKVCKSQEKTERKKTLLV